MKLFTFYGCVAYVFSVILILMFLTGFLGKHVTALKNCLWNLDRWHGRTKRREFLLFALLCLTLMLIIGYVTIMLVAPWYTNLFQMGLEFDDPLTITTFALILLVTFGDLIWKLSCATIRRLHDAGFSGWWLSLALIPGLGTVILFALTLIPSEQTKDEDDNEEDTQSMKSLLEDLLAQIEKDKHEHQQLLEKGGFVDGKNFSIKEDFKGYRFPYVLGIISIIAIFALEVFGRIYSCYENSFICGIIICSSCLIYSIWCCMKGYLSSKSFYVTSTNGKAPKVRKLRDSIGISMLGKYREVSTTYVSYKFFCIAVPIIPLGCYRVEEVSCTKINKYIYETEYRFYSSEEWEIFEVLHIYLLYTGFVTLMIGLIGLPLCLFG